MEQDQENLDMSWKCENEEIYEWEDEERNIIRRNGNGDRGRLGRSTDLGYSTQGSSLSNDDFDLLETDLDPIRENEFFVDEDFQKLITGKIASLSPKSTTTEAITTTPNTKQVLKTRNILVQDKIVKHFKKVKSCSKENKREEYCEETIKHAINRSDDPNLIGDYTRNYVLPLVNGKHKDLKSIQPSTLVSLLEGNYKSLIDDFKIIDCRYPYEYEGGHIKGAINMYLRDQIEEMLTVKDQEKENCNVLMPKKELLVFHCEFSSERAPNLSRFLRKLDRGVNEGAYPKLHFPEMYILEGGYKGFYQEYPDLCVPKNYLPMSHPNYSQEMQVFRSKVKSSNFSSGKRYNKKVKTCLSSQF